jgi:pSer/pThr/pTyr-binding forkhead associated (FHA) protein
MAKLVILTQGLAGRAHELRGNRTTIGRVEDNMFQIVESSVSSHHCEVLLRANDVVIKDLNSTNGTFINDVKITESVLKPGQTLRVGQVELGLEGEVTVSAPAATPAAAPAAAPAKATAPAPAKKPAESTMVMQRGVSPSALESGGRPTGFDTGKVFSPKTNRGNTFFWIGAVLIGVVILVLLFVLLKLAK